MALSVVQLGSNQTLLTLPHAQILFSYSTPVAARVQGTYYRTNKKYSSTTSKHINAWIAGRRAEQRDPAWFAQLADGTAVE